MVIGKLAKLAYKMTPKRKAALSKAVKASAIARRKSSVKLGSKVAANKSRLSTTTTKLAQRIRRNRVYRANNKPVLLSKTIKNQRLTGSRKRAFIKKYTNPKNFKGGMTNGKMMTPKQQASNFKSIMKSNIRLHNKTLKEQAKIVRRAERAEAGGIDWVSSIGWSVALTAAVNPAYTREKLKEAEKAIKNIKRELRL